MLDQGKILACFIKKTRVLGIFSKGPVPFTFPRPGKTGIRVEVLLGRGLIGNVLTVFLPTLLLNIIGKYYFENSQQSHLALYTSYAL